MKLTPKQREAADLLADGFAPCTVARKLGCSPFAILCRASRIARVHNVPVPDGAQVNRAVALWWARRREGLAA